MSRLVRLVPGPGGLGRDLARPDLDSSLIVPLIKRAEPEGAGGSSPLSWPEGDTPIAGELVGELYVFHGFDLPGAFRLVSRRDCARMQLDAGDLRPLAVREICGEVPTFTLTSLTLPARSRASWPSAG